MIDKIVELKEAGQLTWAQIGERVGLSAEAARARYRRQKVEKVIGELEELGEVDEVDEETEPIEEFDNWDESIDRIETIKLEYKKRNSYSSSGSVTLRDELPIIVVTADWHIGLKSVDHKALKQDIHSWLSTDGLYVIINGDIIENGIGTQGIGSATEQLISPKLQHNIAKDIVNQLDLSGKLILATEGNHGERSNRVLFETVDLIYEDVVDHVPLFGNKGVFNVMLNNERYKFFVGHKMPGSTDTNFFGAHTKILRTIPRLDVAAIAHIHTWSHAEIFYQGQYVQLIINGTYSVNEEYAVRFYNPIGNRVNHYLVLHNDKHCVVHFENLKDAIKYRELHS